MKYIAYCLEFSNEELDKVFMCDISRKSYNDQMNIKKETMNKILEKLKEEKMSFREDMYLEDKEYLTFINELREDNKLLSISEFLCTDFSNELQENETIFSQTGSLKEKLEHLKKLNEDHEPSYSRDIDEVLPT